MPFRYSYLAVTANCGNDTLGQTGVNKIIEEIKSRQLLKRSPGGGSIDFVVINCQEADFKNTYNELSDAINRYGLTSYKLAQVAEMKTKTKWETLLGGYGMATFVIYDTDRIELSQAKNPLLARRNPLAYGTAFNKGGLISYFRMTPVSQKKGPSENNEFIDVQAISGHLDSNNATKRNLDFSIINQAISSDKENITYDDLVEIIPNIQVAGYDANTRNTLGEQRDVHNPWMEDNIETEAMKRVPLGAGIYSNEST